MMTTTTANIILIIITITWSVLSINNDYFMPLTAELLKFVGILATWTGAIAVAQKFGGGKQ